MRTFDRCPACESKELEITASTDTVEHKGLTLLVDQLAGLRCLHCGYEFESHSQHDANIARIKEAYLAARVKVKSEQGLLSGREIRAIRERLSLRQEDAALLFGGGRNAFSKYEREDVLQSQPMDRLLRLVAAIGQPAIEFLRDPSRPPSWTVSLAHTNACSVSGAALVYQTINRDVNALYTGVRTYSAHTITASDPDLDDVMVPTELLIHEYRNRVIA